MIELNMNVVFYNEELMQKYDFSSMPKTMEEFTNTAHEVLRQQRAMDIFKTIGMAGNFANRMFLIL